MDVTAAFRSEGFELDKSAAAECRRLCEDYSLTPEDLLCKWEAYAMSRGRGIGAPSAHELRDLVADLGGSTWKKAAVARRVIRPPKGSNQGVSTSLVRRIGPPPPIMTVDDFFSYVDDPLESSMYTLNQSVPPRSASDSPRIRGKGSVTGDDDCMEVEELAAREGLHTENCTTGCANAKSLPGDDDLMTTEQYQSRSDIGRVLSSLNDIDEIIRSHELDKSESMKVEPLSEFKNDARNPFLYMNDDVNGIVESVRNRIREVGQRILARRAVNLPSGMDNSVSSSAFYRASPNTVLAAGRIRVDLDHGEDGSSKSCSVHGDSGRINAASVLLESEDGNVVRLSLSRLKTIGCPLFVAPGMIVVAEGVNKNGTKFDVHCMYDNSAMITTGNGELGQSAASKVQQSQNPCNSTHMARVMAAAGPFTLPGNLKYKPLDDFLKIVEEIKPHVVILIGPFVDVNHELVDEYLPVPFDDIFKVRVIERIASAASRNPMTQFIVIPSISDVHHLPICPQPAFEIGDVNLGVHNNIKFESNPTSLCVSNSAGTKCTVLGITSLPTIQDISGDSLCWGSKDRFCTLASHMVRQWSFYPSFPPSKCVPLDVSNSSRLSFPNCGLDVLIVPSVLMPFAKAADEDIIAINPGLMVRGASGGGSYADFVVPLSRSPQDLKHQSSPSHDGNNNAQNVGVRICRL